MRTIRALVPLLYALPMPAALAGEITVDAGRGPITVRVPDGYDPAQPAPLILLLHGLGASGWLQEGYMRFRDYVDAYGFLYAYPDGTTNSNGVRFWNGTDVCCDFENSGVDDSGYLADLVDAIKAELSVDPLRVHFIGHSNGGFMAHRMACDHSGRIASIVSLAGVTWLDLADCGAAEPVHVLQIHGTEDTIVLYDGAGPHSPYPGAIGTVERWADVAGCSLVPDTSAPPLDLDALLPGAESTVMRYRSGCAQGGSAELWTIVGGEHGPELSDSFQPHVLDFLFAHPKPEVGVATCVASASSTGLPGELVAYGSASASAEDLTLVAFNLPLGAPGMFIASLAPDQVPFGDGWLCVDAPVVRLFPALAASPGGEARLRIDFAAPSAAMFAPGTEVHLQHWFRDPAGGTAGFNLTRALKVRMQP